MTNEEQDRVLSKAAMVLMDYTNDFGAVKGHRTYKIALILLAPLFAKIEALEAENADLHTRFSRLLCHATGGELSKTDYLSETMEAVVTDYINKEREEAFSEGRQEALEETGAKIAEVEFARDIAQRDADNAYKRLGAEIAALRQDQLILNALRAGGVENWEWYEDSLESILGEDTPK